MMFEVGTLLLIFIVYCALFIVYLIRTIRKHERLSYKSIDYLKMDQNTCVVVLGAAADLEGPSAELASRLNLVFEVSAALQPHRYVLYGGQNIVNESEVMKTYLVEMGIHPELITADSEGINTRVSLTRFAEIAKVPEFNQIVVISSGYHAYRIYKVAQQLGLRVVIIAPKNSPEIQNPKVYKIRLISEVLAILWYRAPAWIVKRVDTGPNSFRQRIPRTVIKLLHSK